MSVSFANQLTPNANPVNTRNIRDANWITPNVALPASVGTANTNALDLQQATPFSTTETINVNVVIGAVSTGTTNNIVLTAKIQHTAANSDGTANSAGWTNIPELGSITATDVATAGWAQASDNFKLPPTCKQFIRAQYSLPANGGNASTGSGYMELLF